MVVYKLHYLDSRGRAEPIRMLLFYCGIKFEDIRYEPEKWESIKNSFVFQKVPVLEIDGKKLSQSVAIMRYLAKQHRLAGNNIFDQARVDEAADVILDFHDAIIPYLSVAVKVVPGDVHESEKEILQPALDKYFPILRKFLSENNGTYLATKYLTFVDFQAADVLFTVRNFCPHGFDHYADLSSYINRIFNLTRLRRYLEARPKTEV
ncbi:unnamed protein product [Bursaphelenchus okinawaensis]|uniref:glutathione transferase n=1 Tax=Bursaphelenchus okinawaensis TaxID=465554 RepID=A0A811KY07_9BILA|nr:unnamed protein product [Bursaphelenchus okinawaensis]CAG9114075.1 unnamed protein product [Bursaphelenchus okinawaensis]